MIALLVLAVPLTMPIIPAFATTPVSTMDMGVCGVIPSSDHLLHIGIISLLWRAAFHANKGLDKSKNCILYRISV